MTRHFRKLALIGAAALLLGVQQLGIAQEFPTRPIRWIVTYPPGGTTDVIARQVAEGASKELGVAIVVENRAGAGGRLGMDAAAKARPDGYTFLVSDASIATAPSLFKELPFSPAEDLRAVALFATVPHVVVANPALPARTVAQLVADGKESVSTLNFASGGVGSPLHLAGEVFRAATGMRWTHIPYNGAGPAILAVVTNEAQVALPSAPAALAQVSGGKLRALAVTSDTRMARLPDVPTVAELGFPKAAMSGWVGLHAPSQVPAAITAKVQQAVVRALANPELKARLEGQGASVSGLGAEAYAEIVTREIVRWNGVVKAAGIKPE